MPRKAQPKWVWKCPRCKQKQVTYVELSMPAICRNHVRQEPVYMVLTSQPNVDTIPE